MWCGFEGKIEEVSILWLVCTPATQLLRRLQENNFTMKWGGTTEMTRRRVSAVDFTTREQLARVSELLITSTKSARPKLIEHLEELNKAMRQRPEAAEDFRQKSARHTTAITQKRDAT